MLSELPELPAGKIKINRRQLDRRTAGSMKSRQIGTIIKCLGLDLEFVTCGVKLLRSHCTDVSADQGVILGDFCYLLFLKTFHYNFD